MRARWILLSLLMLPGCKLFPIANGMPLQIKAVLEGEIKGYKIRCEKIIDLSDGRWGVMCNVGNGLDVKYRIRSLSSDMAQVEFVVGRSKAGQKRIIASPTVLVKKAQIARTVATRGEHTIMVMAERIE